MRAILGIVAAGLILAGCGSAGTGTGSIPSPTPSASAPGLGFDVVVTEKTTAVTMRAGQKVEVVLHSNPSMSPWVQLKSSDESVLAPTVNPAAAAVRGVTLAAFRALAPGEATVTAIASPVCSPGNACPMYVAIYSLKVTVTV